MCGVPPDAPSSLTMLDAKPSAWSKSGHTAHRWAVTLAFLAILSQSFHCVECAKSPELMWSCMPTSDAVLTTSNIWEDVRDMNLTVRLDNEAELLASYFITVVADRAPDRKIPGSDFFSAGVSLSSAQRSFLQLRLVVNNLPYRQSSSHASPGFALEATSDSLSGHAAVSLGPGAHSIQLQWKKSGDGVDMWSSRPTTADGYVSGRTIVATARHRYLWHTHADEPVRIETEGVWADVPGAALKFVLQETTSLRFLYSMTLRSDQVETLPG